MKKLYMVQPNSQYGKSIYFPYAAGTLVAYAFKDENIKKEYTFAGFIYDKPDIDKAVDFFDEPSVVGFSCYVWNYEYNCTLARAIKEKYPDCIIIFGGHQIDKNSDVVKALWCDYVIFGEGEEIFSRLLTAIANKDNVGDIPNICYKTNGFPQFTPEIEVQIPERVSPYTEGYFDDILKDKRYDFSAVFETNRGCPNKCAFCDWGNIKSRVRLYDMKTVKEEILWFAENRIEYCYCADANFGLFPRDIRIVDYLIEVHNKTGFPLKFQATYSKINSDVVFEINNKLNAAGMSKGATLSFQSMSQSVLDNIYRKNMPLSNFKRLMTMYNTNGISTYSELILGLPGESYRSFKDGIEQLLQSGQHMSINFFNCELLTNSIMNDAEYIKKYNIKSRKIRQHQYHVIENNDGIREYSNIVVSTDTMPEEMWIKSNILSVYVRFLHNLGLLQCIAIYLYYEKHIDYTDFYERIIEYSRNNPDTVCGSIYTWLLGVYNKVLSGGGTLTGTVDGFGELTWPVDEAAFLLAVNDYDRFYAEIRDEVKPYFDDSTLFDELYAYQKAIVKNPYSEKSVMYVHYDFCGYFRNIYNNNYAALSSRKMIYTIDETDVPKNKPDYARDIVWFGRKGGKNIASVKCEECKEQ